MRRGENIEILVQKSNDMSVVSKNFYTTAKKTNSRCCTLI